MNINGSYRLKKYGYLDKKTEDFKPISDWYSGEIHYQQNGHMTVLVRFAENPQDFTDIVAYSGTYEVLGNEIHHQVTESVRPSYLGQKLTRIFKLEKDLLYTEFENTEEFIKYANWEKIK